MRGIEIEVPDQSDVVPSEILNQQKGKQKLSVDEITKSLPPLNTPLFLCQIESPKSMLVLWST